jgi:hypothetical protein
VTLRFIARTAGVDDSDCLVAGVAEHEDGTGRSLMFQGMAEDPPSQQDIDLEQDTYCLVTETQGTAYGCVEELAIEGDVLRLVLRPDSLDDLDLDETSIEVQLAVSPDSLDAFRRMLREILECGRPNARPRVVRL